MATSFAMPQLTAEAKDHYRINEDEQPAEGKTPYQPAITRFPKSSSERREYIFNRTGYSAKPMDWRGWYWFNFGMNKGLGIGLPTDGSDRTLAMLSLIDHSLAQVPRFVRMTNMSPMRADSTAAHSKQVMNIIQQVFEDSGLAISGKFLPPVDKSRQDDLLGAWVHDMGETPFELTTASDMFQMNPGERTAISEEKNKIEGELFPFLCELARHYLDAGNPGQFNVRIWEMRRAALAAGKSMSGVPLAKPALIRARIAAIRSSMQSIAAELALPTDPAAYAPETQRLVDVYQRTEEKEKGGFMHAVVKTLESVEGQRYLQRQAAPSSTDELSKMLHAANDNDQSISSYPEFAKFDLYSDHEFIESARRCEKRLPLLFELAKTDDPEGGLKAWQKQKLARAVAAFTYRSIGRPFDPRKDKNDPSKDDHVGLAPAYINRAPVPETRDPHTIPLPELERIRAADLVTKSTHYGVDPNVWSREKIGALYRAAAAKVQTGSFIPTTASLISASDSPEIPAALQAEMQKILTAQQPRAGVINLPSASNSGRGV